MLEISDSTAAQAFGIGDAVLRGAGHLPQGTTLTLHVALRITARASAPNVVAVLDGSDPAGARQYVLFSAHMDHIGVAGPNNAACRSAGGDSICNGADDDASGTVAVIEIARAFARLTPHPRRSLVFLTVSGEEKGLWGSGYFTAHPMVPLDSLVADLNIDMVGRNWTDTIAVIGKEQSSLGATVDSVAAAHPELRMTPIRDPWPAENFYERSDHYNFARRGVPILFFFNGVHADYHRVSDEVAKIDGEKEARIVQLIFYTGLALAEARGRPRWDADSYRRVVESAN
jgi:Zn-dependent M28 family amino/carboxypeptidase